MPRPNAREPEAYRGVRRAPRYTVTAEGGLMVDDGTEINQFLHRNEREVDVDVESEGEEERGPTMIEILREGPGEIDVEKDHML